MAAEQPRTPPPDAGGVTRRQLLKAGAGAATVGAVSTREGPLNAIEPVAADELVPTETKYTAAGALIGGPGGAVVGLWMGTKIEGYQDAIDSAIAADEVEGWKDCNGALESFGRETVQVGNTLTASHTMAHQEARDGIADAWEAGEEASAALSAAHDRINKYYAERPEHNWLVEIAAHLLKIASGMHGAITALVEGGEYNRDSSIPWSAGIVNHPTLGDSSFSELIPSTNTTELTLLDGSTTTLEFPDLRIIWDSSDTSTGDKDITVNAGEFLVGHTDPGTEPSIQVDGEAASWDLNISVPNVVNPDGEDLPGKTVFYQRDAIGTREDIKSQAQTVVNGYSQTFVDTLYSELDAGNLDPNDIRGIDGTAQHLAGTEDAYSDAYVVSLANQLGLEQLDLSQIASMTVGYRGFAGQRADDSGGSRAIFPDAYKDSASWRGLLFAESVPSTLEAGKRYACDPIMYSGSHDNTLQASTLSGSQLWSVSYNDRVNDVAVSPIGDTVYIAGHAGYAKAIDAQDGTELWSFDAPANYVNSVCVTPDASTVACVDEDGVTYALDADTGNELWSLSTTAGKKSAAVSPDSQIVFSGAGSGSLMAYTVADGAEEWSVSLSSSTVSAVAPSPDGSDVIAASGSTVYALDPTSGSTNWSVSPFTGIIEAVAVSPDSDLVFACADDGTVKALTIGDGTVEWSVSPISESFRAIEVSADSSLVLAGMDDGGIYAFDAATGSTNWTSSSHSNWINGISTTFNPAVRPDLSVAGMILDAYFYDAQNSEQHRLFGGILTIDQMTGQDGSTVETTDSGDVGTPDWDQTDVQSYAEMLDKIEAIQQALKDNYDNGDDPVIGGGTTDDGDNWLDQLVAWIIANPAKALIVGVGGTLGLNVATS